MNVENVFKKTYIINNSYSRQQIKKFSTFSSPFRNKKEKQKYNFSSTNIINKNTNKNIQNLKNINIKEENYPYLMTELKTNRNNINYFIRTLNPKKNQNKKLLKNIILNEGKSIFSNDVLPNQKIKKSSIFFLSKKNIKDKNMDEIPNYNFYKTHYRINNSKLHLNSINSLIHLYNNNNKNNKSNEPHINYKKNNTYFTSIIGQTSDSYYINTERNRTLYLKNENNNKDNNNIKDNIKRFRLNIEKKDSPELNKVTYIDEHIKKILSKENESKKNKLKLVLNNKIKNKEILFSKPFKFINEVIKYPNKSINEQDNNKNNIVKNNIKLEGEINKGKRINYVNFKEEMDTLVHRVKLMSNHKEFENYVMTLTNEELYYILNNYDIYPLLKKLKLDLKPSNSFEQKSKKLLVMNHKNEDNSEKNIISKKPILDNNNSNENKKDQKTIFPKIIYKNKTFYKKNAIIKDKNIKINKSNIYNKKKGEEKKSEVKHETSLKEDLSFLGNSNSNKLNWDLISDEDKKRGEEFWRKFLRYILTNKIDNNEIISKEDKKIDCNNLSSFRLNFGFLNYEEIKNYKSARTTTNQFLKEHNDRKNKYSLDLYSYMNKNNSENGIKKKKLKKKKKGKFNSIFGKNNSFRNKIYFNKIKSNYSYKNSFNKNISKNSKYLKKNNIKTKLLNNINEIKEKSSETDDEEEEVEESGSKRRKKIIIKKSNNNLNLNLNSLEHKKDVYFFINEHHTQKKKNTNLPPKINFFEKYRRIRRESIKMSKKNKKLEEETLRTIKMYLMQQYKLSDANYSSINLDFEKVEINSENIEKNNEVKITSKKKDVIVDLFGIKVKVKNTSDPLKEYMLKRHIEEKELAYQIEFKNKLLILIKKLEEEKNLRTKRKKSKNKKREKGKETNNDDDINAKFKNILKIEEMKDDMDNDSDEESPLKRKRFFKKKNYKSRKEIEMRKVELLLEIKHDLNYKIMKGDIYASDYDIYEKLIEKLKKLIGLYSNDEYLDILEECFNDFQKEVHIIEQRKKNEQRINDFLKNLKDQFYVERSKKNFEEKKMINVVNYDSINHINILNNI